MKRMQFKLAAVSLVIGLTVAAGCEKKEEKAAGGKGAAGVAATAASVAPGKGFAVFPASTPVLVGVNFNTIRSSALWTKYKDQVEKAASGPLGDLRTACGMDPLGVIETVIVGANPQSDEGVIVLKGLDRGALKSCGEKMAAKDGKKLTITDEGTLSNYVSDNGKSIWAAWLDDKTVVMAPEKDKAYAQARAAGTAGLTDAAPVMALLKSVDTSAALYLAADLTTMGQSLPVQGAKGAFGSLRLTDGLSLDAGIRFDTPENAKSTTAMVSQQLQAMKGQQLPPQLASFKTVLDKAVIKQVNNDMVVQLSLTGPELDQLATALQGMAGMLGGLGGGL